MESVELRKLFCGGLSESTTDDSLGEYFRQFGQMKSCKVVMNQDTNTSKKFAFIEYMDRHSADRAVESGPHEVDGKRIDTKLAVRKDIVDGIKNGATKLFVGGIPKDSTKEDVINFFNNHELNVKVKDFVLKKNRETDVSRGFGFLTPENDHHLAKIAHVQHFTIKENQKTECVLANENNQQGGQPMRGGRGGQGGRGGYQQQGGRGGYQQGGRGGYHQQAYSGYDQSYGNGYDYSYGQGGYGDGYGGYGYDQNYGNAYSGGYSTPPATGGRGRGGRGQYHPYSRS